MLHLFHHFSKCHIFPWELDETGCAYAAIKVDEEGSEAAAVSSAGVFVTSPSPTPPAVFHVDHPFLYLITEASTGAVLFAGRYGLRD